MIDATPLLSVYARRRTAQLSTVDPVAEQVVQLMQLVRRGRQTRFGYEHGFTRIRSPADFQRCVPLRKYEDFWRDYWQPTFPRCHDVSWPGTIPYYALTSGTTTGNTKYVPITRAMLRANRRAVLDVFTFHLAARPSSRVLGGQCFMLGGSTDLTRLAPGIYSGDLSGIAANEVPWWVRPRFFPPPRLALIADWNHKIEILACESLRRDIRAISGTPSWVLPFLKKLADLQLARAGKTQTVYPNLELFIHGGVNYAPYRAQFDALLLPSVDQREVYPASEGFIAVADRSYGEGLRLIIDNGLFFEFVPVEEIYAAEPKRHWLGTVEIGVNYAVALSSNAGLWAYLLGDTVRFIDLDPPRLLITGRLSYTLSAFGEHLIGEELDAAVLAAADEIGAHVVEYTVAPVFPKAPTDRGGHDFIVEFATNVTDDALTRFREALDADLSIRNADYAAHRAGMRAPRLVAAAPGSFAAWMQCRGRAGGQNKVPRVINDPDLLAELLLFLRKAPSCPDLARPPRGTS